MRLQGCERNRNCHHFYIFDIDYFRRLARYPEPNFACRDAAAVISAREAAATGSGMMKGKELSTKQPFDPFSNAYATEGTESQAHVSGGNVARRKL